MIDSYLTITRRSEGFYKEKGSKFIGIALPCENESEVKDALEEIKKEFYDARHHCFAFILGQKGEQIRANDDGEPNHSAGDPILGQIKSKELTNTLVVVVRYFGGTKLGVSGLITAYKTAAQEAIEGNVIKEVDITDKILFEFAYEQMNDVMKLVKDYDLNIIDQQFEMDCRLTANSKVSQTNSLKERVQLLNDTGTPIKLQVLE